jgi:hypothetical protein
VTEQQVKEALERAQKATPQPWRTGPINYADVYGGHGEVIALVIKDTPHTIADAQMIAHSREDIPAMAEMLQRAAAIIIGQESEYRYRCPCKRCKRMIEWLREWRGERS